MLCYNANIQGVKFFMEVLLWIILTLGIASFSGILGKRYGVEYPIAIMAALVVIADVLANKLVIFMGFTVPAGVIVASATFLMTDILSEKWGKKISRRAVMVGLYAKILLLLSLSIAIFWPAPSFAMERAEMFGKVLGMTPRITIASIVAYFISQNHDVWSYHFWMKKTDGKYLWLRNNASTMVSQLIDSFVFVFIAFYGVMPVWTMTLHLWLVKLVIAVVDTPFIYAVTWVTDKFNDNKVQ